MRRKINPRDFDYPYNLLVSLNIPLEDIPDNVEENLEDVLNSPIFNDRDRQFIYEYFKENKYQTVMAKEHDLTITRVGQIMNKNIRRLTALTDKIIGTDNLWTRREELKKEIDILERRLQSLQTQFDDRFSGLVSRSVSQYEIDGEMTLREIANRTHLSVRAVNALSRGGYTTLDKIRQMSEHQLLNLRNCGYKTANDIKEKLRPYGAEFKTNKKGF